MEKILSYKLLSYNLLSRERNKFASSKDTVLNCNALSFDKFYKNKYKQKRKIVCK